MVWCNMNRSFTDEEVKCLLSLLYDELRSLERSKTQFEGHATALQLITDEEELIRDIQSVLRN